MRQPRSRSAADRRPSFSGQLPSPRISILQRALLYSRERRHAGYALQLAIVVAFALIIGIAAFGSRTGAGLIGSVFQGQNRDARDVAESAIAEFGAVMNREANRFLLIDGLNSSDTPTAAQHQNPCASYSLVSNAWVKGTPATGVTTRAQDFVETTTDAASNWKNLDGNSGRQFRVEKIEYFYYDKVDGQRKPLTPNSDAYKFALNGADRTLLRVTILGRVMDGSNERSRARVAREFEVVPKCCKRSFGRNVYSAKNWGRDKADCPIPLLSGGGNGIIGSLDGGSPSGSGNELDIVDENGNLVTKVLCWAGNKDDAKSDLGPANGHDAPNPACINGQQRIGNSKKPGISFMPTPFNLALPTPYFDGGGLRESASGLTQAGLEASFSYPKNAAHGDFALDTSTSPSRTWLNQDGVWKNMGTGVDAAMHIATPPPSAPGNWYLSGSPTTSPDGVVFYDGASSVYRGVTPWSWRFFGRASSPSPTPGLDGAWIYSCAGTCSYWHYDSSWSSTSSSRLIGWSTLDIDDDSYIYLDPGLSKSFGSFSIDRPRIRICETTSNGIDLGGCKTLNNGDRPDACLVTPPDLSAIPPIPYYVANCRLRRMDSGNDTIYVDTSLAKINIFFDQPGFSDSSEYMGGGGNTTFKRVHCDSLVAYSSTSRCQNEVEWEIDGDARPSFQRKCDHTITDINLRDPKCSAFANSKYDMSELLNIFADGEGDFDLNGGSSTVGFNLYAPFADVELRGGGNAQSNFMGRIWADDIYINGSVSIRTPMSLPSFCDPAKDNCPPPNYISLFDFVARSFSHASGF